MAVASSEFLDDQIPQLHANSVYHKHIAIFRKVQAFFIVLWSKVPDELDLIHRYVLIDKPFNLILTNGS